MNKSDSANEVLNFWFSEKVKPLWFKKNAEFDLEIKQRFLEIYQLATTGALDHWRHNSRHILALIIVLDQFSRNIFRNTPQAFAMDSQAVELTNYAVDNNYQQALSREQQVFLYMPLMHSENKSDQAKCVELFAELGKEDNLKFALKHQAIIDRFGRFPHRNQILGRESTPTEQEFLTQPGSSF
ncbi:MAG: DUF924 family protein [Pleurocapsa sp.]